MALKKQSRGRGWSFLHFLLRVLGLTGLLAAAAGGVLAGIQGLFPPWNAGLTLGENFHAITEAVSAKIGDTFEFVIVALILAGGAVALLALLVEIISMLRLVAGRRSAFGGNV